MIRYGYRSSVVRSRMFLGVVIRNRIININVIHRRKEHSKYFDISSSCIIDRENIKISNS